MHFHQICRMHVLIFGGHACESTWLQTVLLFLFPIGVCIDVNFILAYVTIGSYISPCQPITHLQLFTREDTLKKCWLSMSLRMLQSGCNYLK